MWVMPTRGRQSLCQQTLDAIAKLSPKCEGVVWNDGDPYPDLRLPPNWMQRSTDRHVELGGILRRAFHAYQDREFLGFISDDTVPQTPHWNIALELSAAPWRMASSNDLWKGPSRMAGALCFGGELLRALGYWVPKDMCHLYIDDVWEKIGRDLDCWVYRKDVVVEHKHFANGKRTRDDTDRRSLNGRSYGQEDQRLFEEWAKTADEDIARVKDMRVLRTAAA